MIYILYPSIGGPTQRAEWVNTAAPEFHLGLRVAKSPSSLMSFCSPSYFSAKDCCFACVSFHIPILPQFPVLSVLSRTFPSQNPVEYSRSRPLFQRISFPFPLFFPSVLSYARSRSLLQRISFPFLPCTSLYYGFYLICVCIVIFFPLLFTGIFLKSIFKFFL